MVNSAFNFLAGPRDLCLERDDPRLQLRHRERVQILTHQLAERVTGAGKRVFELHDRQR